MRAALSLAKLARKFAEKQVRPMVKKVLVLVGLQLIFYDVACLGSEKKSHWVEESIEIMAKPIDVFLALRKYRNSPIDHRKLVKEEGTKAIIGEVACKLPVIGQVHNLWEEEEQGTDRIDYHLIQSDIFKSGQGSYIITQSDPNGPSTLTLRSELDTGIHFPGSTLIERKASRKDIRARLDYVKDLAEKGNTSESLAK